MKNYVINSVVVSQDNKELGYTLRNIEDSTYDYKFFSREQLYVLDKVFNTLEQDTNLHMCPINGLPEDFLSSDDYNLCERQTEAVRQDKKENPQSHKCYILCKEQIEQLPIEGKDVIFYYVPSYITNPVTFIKKNAKNSGSKLKRMDLLFLLTKEDKVVIYFAQGLHKRFEIRFPDDSSCLFEGCKARSIDLSCIDTSNVIKTDDMFKNCTAKIIGFNV